MTSTKQAVFTVLALSFGTPVIAHAQAEWEDAPVEEPVEAAPEPAPEEMTEPDAVEAPPPPPGPRRRKMNLETPEPARLPMRPRRLHDGLYFRLSAGVGYHSSEYSNNASFFLDDRLITGGGGMFDIKLGGTPARGFVLGGALLMSWGEAKAEVARSMGATEDSGVALVMVGPFVDFFPDPRNGFHFGGSVGLAASGLGFEELEDEMRVAGGAGAAAWIGYDFWIANEWSLGAELRWMGARTRNEDFDYENASNSLGIMFTALYH